MIPVIWMANKDYNSRKLLRRVKALKSSVLRSLAGVAAMLLFSQSQAGGLGQVRRQPVLGESFRVDIELVSASGKAPDASCFSLKAPEGVNLRPWGSDPKLTVRAGQPAVLAIRSNEMVREPAMRLVVELACGSDVSREYTVLASPRRDPKALDDEPEASSVLRVGRPEGGIPAAPRANKARPASPPAAAKTPPPPAPMPVPEAAPPAPAPAAAEVVPEKPLAEAAPAPATPPVVEPVPAPVVPPVPVAPPVEESAGWWLYVVMLLGVVGVLGGMIGVRRWRERQPDAELPSFQALLRAAKAPSPAAREADALLENDDHRAITVVEEPEESPPPAPAPVAEPVASEVPPAPLAPELALPEGEAAVAAPDQAVNPVMELAEIMLSFGRVKGAAQALQEYIDRSPDEALQPWIRLLDVYRLAGMREEFEAVARNLNQTFNVELQSWDEMEAAAAAAAPAPDSNIIEFTLGDQPAAPVGQPVLRPQSLEDMPRVMQMIVDHWPGENAVEFMHGLLRDNRGGTRLGFARPVVEELLMLIDVREQVSKMAAAA